MPIEYKERKLSVDEYIDFLKRTDLGLQYPKERFKERIEKLVNHTSISLVAQNANDKAIPFYEKLGMEKADDGIQNNPKEFYETMKKALQNNIQ